MAVQQIAGLIVAACCAGGAPRAESPQAVPVDGAAFSAPLTRIGPSWQLEFTLADGVRVLPAAELVCWGRFAELENTGAVILPDGGLLSARSVTADNKALTARTAAFGQVKLPLEHVAGVVFQLPRERLARDLLVDRIAAASGRTDRLILTNGDQLGGAIQAIDEKNVSLSGSLGPAAIPVTGVQAAIFNPLLVRKPAFPGPSAWAGFADGSRLRVVEARTGGGALQIKLAAGVSLSAPLAELVAIQPLGGRAVYLSDLPPATYRQQPYFELSWPLGRDRSVTGGALRAGGRLYLKGLGVHSRAELAYDLREPMRSFQAELAIDDDAAGGGSVIFRVLADGQKKYASPIVRGGQPPLPISVDLRGAKRLELIVDYADRADELDRADWLNARVVRTEGAAQSKPRKPAPDNR